MTEYRMDVVVCGRKLGTMSERSDVGNSTFRFYGFEPDPGVPLPSGMLQVDFIRGVITVRGEVYRQPPSFSADLVRTLMPLPLSSASPLSPLSPLSSASPLSPASPLLPLLPASPQPLPSSPPPSPLPRVSPSFWGAAVPPRTEGQ